MWQIQGQIALDLARERAREARQQALANEARAARATEARLHGVGLELERPGRARRMTAGVLRGLSGVFGSVSDAACNAATRLDHRTA